MPNRVVGDSERDDGKPKKQEGFSKPKSEPAPNRTAEPASSGASPSGLGVGKVGELQNFFVALLNDLINCSGADCFSCFRCGFLTRFITEF